MKSIKKLIKKLAVKLGMKTYTEKEMRLMGIGISVVEEYIHNRKFRRSLKDTKLDNQLKQSINEWK